MVYIPRLLYDVNEKKFQESELLSLKEKIIIVLAEPGAGKSCLLENLAKQLNVKKNTANVFIHSHSNKCISLVIDGFDEINSSVITQVLSKARDTSAEKIILSSRSGEWSQKHTNFCKDIFEAEPLLVYLQPFNIEEQQVIFNSYYPQQDAKKFLEEAERVELIPLLSNPLFLKLFAESYIENNQYFESRYSAFKLAIEGLAKESNPNHTHTTSLPLTKKIELVEDIFCKLMLSGAEGISDTDLLSNKLFPNINILNSDTNINQILSTQFFIPNGVGQYRPVHRIVAEYCAGKFLAKKLTTKPNPLSLKIILSIIAPNNIVRDELRGLFAWMTVLSENQQIQEVLIDLDPYAILANGDPTLLLSSSKRKLLLKLKELNQKDPYFRRSDVWRYLNISSFFDDSMFGELKELLSDKYRDGHLQRLLLELLIDSPLIPKFINELNSIVLDTRPEYKNLSIRRLAGRLLLRVESCEKVKKTWNKLIKERDNLSLSIVSDMMNSKINHIFKLKDYIDFLKIFADILYQKDYNIWQKIEIGRRYSIIQNFIKGFDLNLTIQLLDKLAVNLICTCQEKSNCRFRIGISKIIGMLLDRYFQLSLHSLCPKKIWYWVKNLYFKNTIPKEKSLSVKILSENNNLRQSIIKLAFESLYNIKEIDRMKNLFKSGHSGLNIQDIDLQYIIDFAFQTNNFELWRCFIPKPGFGNRQKKTDLLRRHMREQAKLNPEFLKIWHKESINQKQFNKKNKRNYTIRHNRRYNKKQNNIYAENIKYIQENKQLIESGKHWNFLYHFSYTSLQEPEKIIEKYGDEQLVRNALYNCFNFIEPHIPSLSDLAKIKKHLDVEIILYAHCLEVFKRKNSLKSISKNALKILYTNLNVNCLGMNENDKELLKEEVEKILFDDQDKIKQFLIEYVEPQLAYHDHKNIEEVAWLKYEPFNLFQKELSLEWLEKYPNLKFKELKELLPIAAQFGDIERLKQLVHQRCKNLLNSNSIQHNKEENEIQIQNFWFIHAFYLLDTDYEPYWEKFTENLESIFVLDNHLGSFGDYRKWLRLSAQKVELILNRFFDKYPEVELPNTYGSDSPSNEKAYRFLRNIIFLLGGHQDDSLLPVINRLLNNPTYQRLHLDLKSIRFEYIKKSKIQNFKAPKPEQIVNLLEQNEIISVENLRAVILEELQFYQDDLNGHDITSKDIFYVFQKNGNKLEIKNHVDENTASQYIAERLRLRLENRQVIIQRENYMKNDKRCDIVCLKLIGEKRKILPIEVKGQWHSEIYSAFENQLERLYTIHPDSDGQGIYLVLWFGSDKKVAEIKKHGINSAEELYFNIQEKMSEELKNRIDIFVLDLSI